MRTRFRSGLIWVLAFALLFPAAAITKSAPVTALAFVPDGSAVVSAASRGVEIRSTGDGVVQNHISCDLPKVMTLAFSPSGLWLAVGGGSPASSGEVLIFDWREKKPFHALTNDTDLVTSVAFNADGKLLGVASADHLARVWRIGKEGGMGEVFTLAGHAGPVLAIAFSPAGRTIVTASADRSIKVWSVEDGRLLRTFSHHTEQVHALAFRPRGPLDSYEAPVFCASGGDDRTVRIWQPEIGRMVRIIREHRGSIFALVFSPDGKTLYSAGEEGIVRELDPASDLIRDQWAAHNDWIYALAVSPDGKRLASGDWSGQVRLWNIPRLPINRGRNLP